MTQLLNFWNERFGEQSKESGLEQNSTSKNMFSDLWDAWLEARLAYIQRNQKSWHIGS